MDDETTGTGYDPEEAEEEYQWEGRGEGNEKGAPHGRYR